MASSTGGNMVVVIASTYLVVSAIRDLYDGSRGTQNKSTWFTSVLQFILAFFLFMFARR
jgi:hypothetical protein